MPHLVMWVGHHLFHPFAPATAVLTTAPRPAVPVQLDTRTSPRRAVPRHNFAPEQREPADPFGELARMSLTHVEDCAEDPRGDLIHLSLSQDDRPNQGRADATWPDGAWM